MAQNSVLTVLQDAAKIEDTVLADLGLRNVSVSYRKIKTEGGDDNLGIKGTQTIKDTKIVPNPRIQEINVGNMMRYPMGYVEEGDMLIYLNAKDFTEEKIWTWHGLIIHDKLWKVIKIHADPEDSTPIYQKVLVRKTENIHG